MTILQIDTTKHSPKEMVEICRTVKNTINDDVLFIPLDMRVLQNVSIDELKMYRTTINGCIKRMRDKEKKNDCK